MMILKTVPTPVAGMFGFLASALMNLLVRQNDRFFVRAQHHISVS